MLWARACSASHCNFLAKRLSIDHAIRGIQHAGLLLGHGHDPPSWSPLALHNNRCAEGLAIDDTIQSVQAGCLRLGHCNSMAGHV